MNIIQNRNFYFALSGLLVAGSIVAIAVYGLRLGIDFTGGALSEITVDSRIAADAGIITQALIAGESPALDSVRVQPTGAHGFLLRFKSVSEQEHHSIIMALDAFLGELLPAEEETDVPLEQPDVDAAASGAVVDAVDSGGNPVAIDVVASEPEAQPAGPEFLTEDRFESIGPVIGSELAQKSMYAIVAVLIGIITYIAWAFRKVAEPVSSWKYGVTAIIALAHDVIIPTGVFAVLGAVLGIEIDILFVTALLTILGFSVNDTIVVFDRTRENLARHHHKHEFTWIVEKSVNETMRRSLFTSLTTFVVLCSIFLYGGDSVKYFVLALMIGVIVGTYSSIFLASPLLVVWEQWSRRQGN